MDEVVGGAALGVLACSNTLCLGHWCQSVMRVLRLGTVLRVEEKARLSLESPRLGRGCGFHAVGLVTLWLKSPLDLRRFGLTIGERLTLGVLYESGRGPR